MDDSIPHGLWRMDWGFGNPNKTATLIALVMMAVWILGFIRKWGFWVALTLFTSFGFCLILTQSRGGLVGAFIGGLIVLAWSPRPFPFWRILGVIVACVTLAAFAFAIHAESRFSQGLSSKDRSIDNRILMWEQVPAMIHDAPNGWGLGKSGDAYMQWYQPVNRGEGYRTLVDSHLTWLVELGWWGRIAYVFAWAAVLVLLWPRSDFQWFSIPWAVWIAFGICASFSSVAESLFLWIVPLLALITVLAIRIKKSMWPGVSPWLAGALSACLILSGIFLLGKRAKYFPMVYSPVEGIVILGQASPKIWIIDPNRNVLGEHFGHEIRQGLDSEPVLRGMSIAVAPELKAAPPNQVLVFSGQIPSDFETLASSKIIIINPEPVSPNVLQALFSQRSVTVVVGEYSQNKAFWNEQAHSHSNIKIQLVVGAAEYISSWMHEIADVITN